MNIGVQSIGIKTPIIKQGDDLKEIVIKSIINSMTSYVDGIPEPFDNRIAVNCL